MALQNIEQGSEVISSVLNDNFEYLDGRIDEAGTRITTLSSNLSSLSTTLNNTINNLDYAIHQDLEGTKSELQESIGNVVDELDAISFMPDYNKATTLDPITTSTPYTIDFNGWLSIDGTQGRNTGRAYLELNNIVVCKLHSDDEGGNQAANTNTVMVSVGDVLQGYKMGGNSTFRLTKIPFKSEGSS